MRLVGLGSEKMRRSAYKNVFGGESRFIEILQDCVSGLIQSDGRN